MGRFRYDMPQKQFHHIITAFNQRQPAGHMERYGLGYVSLTHIRPDPDRPLSRVNAPQTPIYGGIQTYVGSLMAHYHRLETGKGPRCYPAPQRGQHNAYVFGELLGLSEVEMNQLQEGEVIA